MKWFGALVALVLTAVAWIGARFGKVDEEALKEARRQEAERKRLGEELKRKVAEAKAREIEAEAKVEKIQEEAKDAKAGDPVDVANALIADAERKG